MILAQEHIINKVFLDVETSSVAVAHTLKDRLGMFLQEEILPYLEEYFKSIEDKLPAEVVQINQLHIEVEASDANDFETLKIQTKEKLVEKIEKMLKTPSQEKEILLINTKESKERSLLFFIENGFTPWWKTSSNELQFTTIDIKEISKSVTFSKKFTEQLKKTTSKKRCIHQFTDKELQILLKAAFKKLKEVGFLNDEIIGQLKYLSSLSRVFIWNEVITYLQSKNEETFILQLYKGLSKTTQNTDTSVSAFSKVVIAIVQQVFNIKKENTRTLLQEKIKNTSQKEEILFYLENYIKRVDKSYFIDNKSVLDFNTEKQGTKSNDDFKVLKTKKNKEELMLSFIEKGYTSERETFSHGFQFSIKDIKEVSKSVVFSTKLMQLLKQAESKKRCIYQFTDEELQILLKATFKNLKETVLLQDKIIGHLKTLSSLSRVFIWNEIITYLQSKNEEKFIVQLYKKLVKSVDNKEKDVLALAKVTLTIVGKLFNTKKENIKIFSQEKTKITSKKEEFLLEQLISICSKIGLRLEVNNMLEIIENESQTRKKNKEISLKDIKQKQSIENFKEEDKSKSIAIPSKEKMIEPLMDTYLKDILPQEESHFSDAGIHYVKNAGLILVHPYLTHFFKNCGLLDDNNVIINQDLAVHALHYLATKKEQQLENYMVFEKFLCGVPLQKTIQRNIILSDSIKEQAEELLKSVVENWGALNNASTDLICHEFLQREGKLSFKEDNPKLVVERKIQDILVDRLPWGIGICKLPWLEKLVFTNW